MTYILYIMCTSPYQACAFFAFWYVQRKYRYMLADIVNIIKDTCLRHIGVRTFRYQDKAYNNAQNSFAPYQAYLSDHSYHRMNITSNIYIAEFELYILGKPERDDWEAVLRTQDECYTVVNNIIAKLDSLKEYEGILSVHDFDIIVLSHYTDDESAGVKCSIQLEVPSPVVLCTLDDNFNPDPYEPEPDREIDVDVPQPAEELTIKTIKLPKNRC